MSSAHVDLSAPGRDLRAGRGQRALGHRRQALPRLPVRPGRDQPRSRPPRGGRRRRRAGPHAAARVEPVRHRARPRGGGHPRPPAGRRRQGLLLQLGGRGQRGGHQAGPQVRRAAAATSWSAPTGPSTAGPWPPSTPPASPRSTRRSSRCPRASATSPGATSTPWRRPLDPTVTAVLLEPVQGEGGVNPADTEYFAGVRRLCDERGVLFMVDEIQTGLGRTGEWFGFQHFGVQPDVVTMAKALGNGVPIGACWARADVAGGVRARRPRHDLRRPAPGHRRRPQGARGDGAGGRPRPGPGRGQAPGRRPARPAPRHRRPGPRPAPGGRTGRTGTPGRWPRPRSTPGWWSTASAPPPCASPPACWSTRPRSTKPSRSWKGSSPDAAPAGDRRPDQGRALRGHRPRPRPQPAPGAVPQGHGPGVREAVGPDPQLHGDGRQGPRRPPGDHPGRGGQHRPAGVGRGRGPHPGLLPRRHRGPGLRPLGARAHGQGRPGCRSSTCCPTTPTPCRRWPTC